MTMLATLAACCYGPASSADPLHKIGSDGAWIHEGSGWLFPKRIGGIDRVGAPYTIDGNDDVGAEYAGVAENSSLTAFIDVYYLDSAANGATLDGAKAMQGASKTGRPARMETEEPFSVNAQSALTGIKVTYESTDDSRVSLYFFETPAWVVTVRATVRAANENTPAALDALIRALPWKTLGSDPGDLHNAGS